MKRKLKIEEEIRCNPLQPYKVAVRVPRMRLCGKWLQAAGFPAGQHLELTVVSPGVIELRVCGQPRADHEFNIAARKAGK